jgi:Tol biopolymer transport system component
MKRMLPGFLTPLILAACSAPEPPPPAPPSESGAEPPITQVTSGRSGEDRDPEISPDGKTLYYASSAFGTDFDLFMRPTGPGAPVRLTSLPGDERFPKVNPARPNLLAFSTHGRGLWEIAILDLARPGAAPEYVSEPGVPSLHPSWSPDGRWLVYSAADSGGEWTLRVRDVAAGRIHVLEDIDGLLPEWSPRGPRIAFQRMRRRDDWMSTIWTVAFEEGSARDLTAVLAPDGWAAINPAWSPDGRHLVFATVGKSPAAAGRLDEGDDLWTVPAEGGLPTRLTSSPAPDWMPAWGADGSIYFCSRRAPGGTRLFRLVPRIPE